MLSQSGLLIIAKLEIGLLSWAVVLCAISWVEECLFRYLYLAGQVHSYLVVLVLNFIWPNCGVE